MAGDARYKTNAARVVNRDTLIPRLFELTKKLSKAELAEKFEEAGVPAGPINTLREVFDDPQVRHQQMRITIDHPKHGPLDVLGFPIKFTDDPCRVHRPPPDLGGDTDAILAELGYAPAEVAELHAKRAA